MRAEQQLDEVAKKLGWNDKIQLIHVLNFINKLVMDGVTSVDDFRAYLEQIQSEEDELIQRVKDVGT